MESSTQELPAELVERLHRLAATQMSESRPWPGVDRAVHRMQRRRLAGMSAAALGCVLIIGMTFSGALGLSSDRSQQAPPAGPKPSASASATATAPTGPLPASGFSGPVGGSLGSDKTWLKQVRARIVEVEASVKRPLTAADVQVLWTSDRDGVRYVYAVLPGGKNKLGPGLRYFRDVVLVGPAGASADKLVYKTMGTHDLEDGNVGHAMYLRRTATALPDFVLIAASPAVTEVEVASSRKFSVDGTVTVGWRSLRREGGAVWVGRLTRAEGYLSEFRSVGGPIRNSTNAATHQPKHRAVTVAPAGSNLAAIKDAGAALSWLNPSLAEQPVLAISAPLTDTATLAATVFRTPEGLALVGFAERDVKFKETWRHLTRRGAAIAKQPIGDPDTFMAVLSTVKLPPAREDLNAGYAVLTPVGATSARIGDVTVPVRNRLALFEPSAIPDGGYVTVEALNAQGTVIASVLSLRGTEVP